ncbi:hypothetical protein SDC9_130114 [bioreactor metagenome]|uniref:Uncharacterized protein n=1 Tax=bioreactor metagenome TaxID=1076179 RepID=A0A645D1L8_9ZZZZ
MHALKDDGFVPDPHIGADYRIALVVPGLGNVCPVKPPGVGENGKGVVGKRLLCVVSAGKEKLCAASDGAELAYDEPIAVDGVVVQHVMPLELGRVALPVVVKRIIAYNDIGVFHRVLQIDGLLVGTRIKLSFRNSHNRFPRFVYFWLTTPAWTMQRFMRAPPLIV